MSKVSLNTFKHKFFYQIIILSLIIISVFVAVSMTTNVSKPLFTNSKAAESFNCNSSCLSFDDVYVNRCTPISKWNSGDPICNTDSTFSYVNLDINQAEYDAFRIQNFDPGTNCNDPNMNWLALEERKYSGSTNLTWQLTGGLGNKKVCVMFTTHGYGQRMCCGGMIKVASPSPTPRPPTPTPRPNCTNGSYRCITDVHGNKELDKCISNAWVYQDLCTPSNTCSCVINPPGCRGQCN